MTTLDVPDSPKMLRETLCAAQTLVSNYGQALDAGRTPEHVARLGRLIDECDRHRPLGPDGKHGDRHTLTCGCEGAQPKGREWLAEQVPRHVVAEIIRAHVFNGSRPWPDGTQPTAPNWNPGCSCGQGMYFFQWDLHLADQILAATPPAASAAPTEKETSKP